MAPKITFTTDNLSPQKFALPKKLSDFILENIKVNGIRKLYQSCKFFYKKSPYFICDLINIELPNDVQRIELEDVDDCIDVYDDEDLDTFDNIWITKEIQMNGQVSPLQSSFL